MISAKINVSSLNVFLNNQEKRFTEKQKVITNESARRLQKYIQRQIDIEKHYRTGKLRSINRGGIHKQKIGKTGYRVYMKPEYAAYVEFGTSRGLKGSHYFEKAYMKFERAYDRIAREMISYL